MTNLLYLKPEEIKFLGMAVVSLLEQLKDSITDQVKLCMKGMVPMCIYTFDENYNPNI